MKMIRPMEVTDSADSQGCMYLMSNSWSTYKGEGDTCGAETDDAYWYMGYTECFRANAAYSLYGVLKGAKDTGCSDGNFINSFFTTYGVEAFTKSVVSSGKVSFSGSDNANGDADEYPGGISSTCYENGGNNRDLGDNYGTVSHNTKYNSGQTSYGLACNGKKFAIKTFKGSYCDSSASQKISNSLSTFNSEINQAQCIPIYSSSSYKQNNNNLKDTSLGLLYNSQSCSIREYPGLCPDPYGKLKHYAAAEERAVARVYSTKQSRTIRAMAILLLVLGCLLLLLSTLIYLRRSRLSRLRAMKRRLMSRRRSHRKKGQPNGNSSGGWFAGDKSGRTRSSSRGASGDDPSGRKGRLFGRKTSMKL
jgi:hypothetical protein